MQSKYASVLLAIAIASSISTANAQTTVTRCIVDVGLVATNALSEPPPLGPSFRNVGYWDAHKSAGFGTRGERGRIMIGLSVKYGDENCLEDIRVIASESGTPATAPAGFRPVGHWDVDNSGGFGADDNSSGAYIMGLYKKWPEHGKSGGLVLAGLHLTASNVRSPAPMVPGHQLVGWWDVDHGGSHGTVNNCGSGRQPGACHFTMTLQRLKARLAPKALSIGRPKGSWIRAVSGGQQPEFAMSRSLSLGNLSEKSWTKETRANVSTTITTGMDFKLASLEVAVTAGVETASGSAGRIAKESTTEFSESCSQKIVLQKGKIEAVWQWQVVTPVGGEDVVIKTCDVTCTPTLAGPRYPLGAPELLGVCLIDQTSAGNNASGRGEDSDRYVEARRDQCPYHGEFYDTSHAFYHVHEEEFYVEELDEEEIYVDEFYEEDLDDDDELR